MEGGVGGRGRKERGERGRGEGQATKTEKHTSQVQRDWDRSDWDPLECNELVFLSFPF